jgi:hypothetical protein
MSEKIHSANQAKNHLYYPVASIMNAANTLVMLKKMFYQKRPKNLAA